MQTKWDYSTITDRVLSQSDAVKTVEIYTDGSCLKNPGRGGYGAVIKFDGRVQELGQGFRLTTNNRMEILAVIESLKMLDGQTSAIVYTDSQYVANAVNKGWLYRWSLSPGSTKNYDLWRQLVSLLEIHDVTISWVKGHSGIPGNEHADRLAVGAARSNNLLVDEGYESIPKTLSMFAL